MYFVLDIVSNKTVAMTAFKDAAEIIAATSPQSALFATPRK